MTETTIDKTDTWFELWDDSGENIVDAFHWPFCQVEGCENRICLHVSQRFCHPHSGGKEADKLIAKLNEQIKEKENA